MAWHRYLLLNCKTTLIKSVICFIVIQIANIVRLFDNAELH